MVINCNSMRWKKEQLQKELDKIYSMEKRFPKGELRCSKNNSRYKWYVKNQAETIYLSKNEREMAEKLAVKKYYTYKKQELESALDACNAYLKKMQSIEGKAEQLMYHPEYGRLLEKQFMPVNEELKEWQNAPYERCNKHEESRIIKGTQGKMLRSKSEAIIDMLLYKNRTEGYEWSITFENKEQYDKVMEFIGQFPSDWNMRFAAHENFWNDFLNDEIDMEGFMEFINGTNKGVPDYSITVGDSMYIDKDKMQWAKYTNPLETRFYTAEEMHQMQMEIIVANQAKLAKLSDSYGEVYKQNHPDYNGERIFSEYPGGPLYTADEIGRLKWEQFLTEMNMTEDEMQQKREEWRVKVGYPVY